MTQRSVPSPLNVEIPDLPDKLYFKIREVSALTGLPAHVLRFWETQFPKFRPKRSSTGQRLYQPTDVHLVLTIKALLYHQKFTIEGANQYLAGQTASSAKSTKAATPTAPDTTEYRKTLCQLRDELLEIRKLLS